MRPSTQPTLWQALESHERWLARMGRAEPA